MSNEVQPDSDITDDAEPKIKSIYQKPQTLLWLKTLANIQSGATTIFESQGDGMFTS